MLIDQVKTYIFFFLCFWIQYDDIVSKLLLDHIADVEKKDTKHWHGKLNQKYSEMAKIAQNS